MVVPEPRRLHVKEPTQWVSDVMLSTSWGPKLLADPTLLAFELETRISKPSTEDSLIGGTFVSNSTVPIWQSFYRPVGPASPSKYGEYLHVLSFGSGLNGHPHVLHGGALSVIMDEIMSLVAALHGSPNTATLTASITVDFKKPVITPGVVLCKAWLEDKSSGRKHWVRATMEDGEGSVYATASCLCLEVLADSLKL